MSMSSLSSIDNRDIGLRRSARIAQCAMACKSRDGDADSPKLKEIVGVNRTYKNVKVVACSSRRKMKSSAHFLPEEIIFNILLWLPAEVLYNVMRYVCREWYNMINDPDFINAHLQKSIGGFLILSGNSTTAVYSVDIRNCDAQIRLLGQEFPLHICGSCDGLVFSYCICRRSYCVINPITGELVKLPPFFDKRWTKAPHIMYVPSTRRYKVMIFTRDENNLDVCLILNVGIDNAWRQIDFKHLPDLHHNLIASGTFSTGGYYYLTSDRACHLFAFDAEAELFHQFNVPNVCHTAIRVTYVVWKSFLALLAHCGEFVWELWALTELSTGEWTRISSIDLSGQRWRIERVFSNDLRYQRCMIDRIVGNDSSPLSFGWAGRDDLRHQRRKIDQISDVREMSLDRCLVPITLLKKGELVVFRAVDPFKTYFVYKFHTGKVYSFKGHIYDRHISNVYFNHVNSLASLKVS